MWKRSSSSAHTPPHSGHPPNIARGMVFSLLNNYNANNSNKTNYSTQVNKTFNDILAGGCTKKDIMETFEEAESKIMRKKDK